MLHEGIYFFSTIKSLRRGRFDTENSSQNIYLNLSILKATLIVLINQKLFVLRFESEYIRRREKWAQ